MDKTGGRGDGRQGLPTTTRERPRGRAALLWLIRSQRKKADRGGRGLEALRGRKFPGRRAPEFSASLRHCGAGGSFFQKAKEEKRGCGRAEAGDTRGKGRTRARFAAPPRDYPENARRRKRRKQTPQSFLLHHDAGRRLRRGGKKGRAERPRRRGRPRGFNAFFRVETTARRPA